MHELTVDSEVIQSIHDMSLGEDLSAASIKVSIVEPSAPVYVLAEADQ